MTSNFVVIFRRDDNFYIFDNRCEPYRIAGFRPHEAWLLGKPLGARQKEIEQLALHCTMHLDDSKIHRTQEQGKLATKSC